MAILPSPLGSQAKPIRGAGLKRCPFRQPASVEEPIVAPGNELVTRLGMRELPPYERLFPNEIAGSFPPWPLLKSSPIGKPAGSGGLWRALRKMWSAV